MVINRKRAEEGKKSDDHRRDAEDNGDSFIERQPSVACEHPPFLENPEIYK